jgi:hypothetical protein
MNRSILKPTMVILTTVGVLFSYAGFASVFHNDHGIAYAQNNQTSSSSSNQTTAKVTGTPQSTILNKTTIPAQQTTVKVNQTTKPVGQESLKPLQNLTQQQQQQQPSNLSGIQNKTMVVPTGKATTTLVNKTTVPFNQTMVKSGSANQTQQQQPSNVTSAAGGSSNASSGNQTQQQNQTNPLSKVPVIGKLFGGK